jgi:hypothetical protein
LWPFDDVKTLQEKTLQGKQCKTHGRTASFSEKKTGDILMAASPAIASLL